MRLDFILLENNRHMVADISTIIALQLILVKTLRFATELHYDNRSDIECFAPSRIFLRRLRPGSSDINQVLGKKTSTSSLNS